MATIALIVAAFTITTAITVIKEMAAMFSSVVEVISSLFLCQGRLVGINEGFVGRLLFPFKIQMTLGDNFGSRTFKFANFLEQTLRVTVTISFT